MKHKQLLIIFVIMALLVAACGSIAGDEPSAVDGPPAGGEAEPNEAPADPDEAVSSEDPQPEPEVTPVVESGEMITGTATIESLQILIMESFPVQVSLQVSGYLGDGCTRLGSIDTERVDDTFQVTVHTIRPADAICTQQLVGFEEVIPLDVEGLEAGSYIVDVNGVTDSFTLDVDNVLTGDEPVDESVDWTPLPEEEQAELIRLTLERALVEGEIPDFQLLQEQGEFVLSTENIDPALVPELEGIELVLLSPEEIQAKADQEGDFPYLRFQNVEVASESEAAVSLGSLWAIAEDSDMIYLSGGGFTIQYTRTADGWTGEVTESWIS